MPNLAEKIPCSPQRLGYFYVSDVLALDHWEELLPVMASVVPVSVAYRADLQSFEYLAFSNLFEEVKPGVAAPCYEVIFTRVAITGGEGFTLTFEFKRSGQRR